MTPHVDETIPGWSLFKPMVPGQRVDMYLSSPAKAASAADRAFTAIIEHFAMYEEPPTQRDICERIGWTNSSTLTAVLFALRDRGLIEFRPNQQRGIRLVVDDATQYA